MRVNFEFRKTKLPDASTVNLILEFTDDPLIALLSVPPEPHFSLIG